jgi:hypothetical protein
MLIEHQRRLFSEPTVQGRNARNPAKSELSDARFRGDGRETRSYFGNFDSRKVECQGSSVAADALSHIRFFKKRKKGAVEVTPPSRGAS